MNEPAKTEQKAPAPKQMDQWERKDYDEKVIALKTLEVQYPEMKKLRDLLKSNPTEFRRQYITTLIATVAKTLDIPVNGIDILGGKPYINKTGLTAKIQKDPRRIKIIKAVPVLYPMEIGVLNQPDDPDFKKFFVGFSKDGTTVYRGIVEFDDGTRFEDEGTANAKYLNKTYGKMSTMVPYIMELAATKATNRAMRLATGIGMVSIEEINERGFNLIKDSMKKEVSTKKIELISEVEKLFTQLKFNQARQLQYCNKFGGVGEIQFIAESEIEKMVMALNDLKKEKVKKLPSPKKSTSIQKANVSNAKKKSGK